MESTQSVVHSRSTLKRNVLCGFVLSMLFIGCFSLIHHEPKEAAFVAERFANKAFVGVDIAGAYNLMCATTRENFTEAQLSQGIEELHPKGKPSRIVSISYGPIPGQKAMNIFLEGDGKEEHFSYSIHLTGTSDDGYRVSAFFRHTGPYDNSVIRHPLK